MAPQEATRKRTQARSEETPEAEQERPQRNERFDSRRSYSRTRNRPVENQQKEIPTTRDYVVRQRPQAFSRRITSTEPTIEVSSPTIDESKIEVVNFNLDDIPRVTPKIQNVSATTFRRRNPPPSTESSAPRRRGRVNTRTDPRPLDLSVSGTTNTFTISKIVEPSTARSAADLKNTKKLRHKIQLTGTAANLTGEGIIANEVTKSSQNKESDTSQPEIQTPATVVMKTTVQLSTEAIVVKTIPSTTTKPGRRPLPRGKSNLRPTVKLSKSTKTSDEIGEDDNYPASFKALIKAKNATVSITLILTNTICRNGVVSSNIPNQFTQNIKHFQTQASSPTSESLSVKASQKVYKTYSSSAQSTNTGSAKNNKYNTRVM